MRLIDADELKERIRKALGIKSLDNLLPSEKTIVNQIDMASTIQPEPCEDAVSRKTILKFLDDWMSALEDNVHNQSASDLKIIKRDFANLPPAQPETTRRIVGKSKGGMTLWYECERCGEPVDEGDKFCRGCGAKMEVTE